MDLSAQAQQQDGPPLAELLPGLSTAVRALARAAKNVPAPSDIYYYKNIPEYKALSNDIQAKAKALLAAAATNLTRPIPAAAGAAGAGRSGLPTSAATAAAAVAGNDEDQDDEAMFERLTTLLDDTYERLDTALDASKASSAALKLGGWALPQHSRQPLRAAARGLTGSSVAKVAGGGRIRRHVADLARPQGTFPDPVDNSEAPWSPAKFTHLAARLSAAAAAGGSGNSNSSAVGVHPFAAELGSLQYQPWQLQKQQQDQTAAAAAVDVLDLDAVPCTFVDTPEGLALMVQALHGVKQLALDLEHHSYRSYQGFTCLLQLSTRDVDWVVDTLALRAQLGSALGPILADPAVEKVLHGADNDILWLQRDFGLYIVNLFDTGQAARVLAYPSASLAYLLEHHVGFSADKRYQLADWRLRPLPEDMLLYARADTRFLLAVCDRVKDELRALGDRMPPSWAVDLPPHSAATGALGCVYERSRQLCLQQYQKPTLTPMTHLETAIRWGLSLPPRNMAVFGALFSWRDRTARALDESVHYVMPKAALIELSRAMPTTAADVRKLFGKGSGLSGGAGLLLTKADEVAQVIAQGQQQQQQLPAAAAPAEGTSGDKVSSAAAGAAAEAVVVKPKELPAIAPRKVGAIAVKAVSVKGAAASSSSSGMRGLFGKASGSTLSAGAQQRMEQQSQEKQPEPSQQPDEQQPPQQQEQQEKQQQQQQQEPGAGTAGKVQAPQAAAPAAADGMGESSILAAKPLPAARKSSSSLGGLFSRKRTAAAAGASGMPAAKKAAFRVDFLTMQQGADTAAADAAADDTAAAAAAAGGAPGSAAAAAGDAEQSVGMQKTSTAEVRAAMDQLIGEGEQSHDAAAGGDDAGSDGSPRAAGTAAGAATAGAATAADEDVLEGGFGDLEYVPLSLQGPRSKKHKRREALAALANAEAAAAGHRVDGKRARVDLEQHNGMQAGKRKGIFDGIGGGSGSSSDESDMEAGIAAMPSFDPARLAAAAAAAAAGSNAAAAATGADEEEGGGDYRGRGRGRGRGRRGRGGDGKRGGRSSGGRGGRGGRGSLASVRRQQGDSSGGVGRNMFEVQDGPFKAARRKGVSGGKSRTFK